MEELESGLVLPAGVRSVRPVDPPAPWRDGEQMGSIDTPIGWLALQRDVKSWGPHLAALYRAMKGRT